jgi:hypothetical protein
MDPRGENEDKEEQRKEKKRKREKWNMSNDTEEIQYREKKTGTEIEK